MVTIHSSFQSDALHIALSSRAVAFTDQLDQRRYVDYAADGSPVGVDLLLVSEGVDIDQLPERDEIEAVLRQLGIATVA